MDNSVLQLKAKVKAESLATTLDLENRGTEAGRLRAVLQNLRQRDLIINLSWTSGIAPGDVSLTVKEPSGTLCSIEQRQTPGGGNLVSADLLGKSTEKSLKSVYTAAQAFPGEYEITVRRNWGQIGGNTARVEVIQHFGTPKETRRLHTISLDQKQTIKINLDS